MRTNVPKYIMEFDGYPFQPQHKRGDFASRQEVADYWQGYVKEFVLLSSSTQRWWSSAEWGMNGL